MFKKLILTFVLSTGLTAILISCCRDIKEFWKMDSFQPNFIDNSGQGPIGDSTVVDSLQINLTLERTYLTTNETDFSSLFVNSSYALSCPHPGENGLKYKMTNVVITSDVDFNSTIDAGENLSSICSFDDKHLAQYLTDYKNPYGEIKIVIQEKPDVIADRNFTIIFYFENGESISGTTNSVVWH